MCFSSWVRCRTSESHLHNYTHTQDRLLATLIIATLTCIWVRSRFQKKHAHFFSTSFFCIANSKLLKPLGGLIPSCGWWISSSSQNGSGHAVGAMLLAIRRLMRKTGWCTFAWHLFFGLLKKSCKIDRNRILRTLCRSFQPWFIYLKTQLQNETKIWKP